MWYCCSFVIILQETKYTSGEEQCESHHFNGSRNPANTVASESLKLATLNTFIATLNTQCDPHPMECDSHPSILTRPKEPNKAQTV
jgi:hypothetical protein